MKPDIRELSLYVHIPFCKAKCAYCDFLSFGERDYREQKQYVSALCNEIESYKGMAKDYVVKTIFFGGGTPSYVDASFMERIMQTICKTFVLDKEAEITIEGNPDSLTKDKLFLYRQSGINRLSIGLQSADDEMLRVLGRVHNYDQFIAAYSSARQAGFSNINVDIMSGLPGETKEGYIRTLAKVVELQPEHISAYSLIVEEGTPLSENEELLNLLPSEEMDRQLYAKTKLLLKNSGYGRYEISNYAKKGYECRHNLVYWTGGEYLGLGLGASSYLTILRQEGRGERIRFNGINDMHEYIGRFAECDNKNENGMLLKQIESNYENLQFLKLKDEMEEYMFLGLRCTKGVQAEEFCNRFGTEIGNIYGKVITKYKDAGFLLEANGRLYLSDAGIDVSNVIMAEFLL